METRAVGSTFMHFFLMSTMSSPLFVGQKLFDSLEDPKTNILKFEILVLNRTLRSHHH